ncbi:MAG TPA: helix-turn-helix domain-containing protein [Propionibacteriaceae bacterium]
MTDFSDPPRTERRMSLDSARDLNTLRSPANRPEAIPTHVQGRAPSPHGNIGGQPPAELIAHLVIALSRYLRQLRSEGGRVPTQIEDLITLLADRVRAPHDVPMLHSWPAASGPLAVPRRLLITKSEAARQLDVSLRTIERLISAGRLPLVHVEGAARVRVTDLEAYVQGLEADARPNPSPAQSLRCYASPAPPPSAE